MATYNYWKDAVERIEKTHLEGSRRRHLDKLHSLRYADDAERFRKYGLSVIGYQNLLAQQNGVCAICREPGRELCVDHDHKTGRVRSLLCNGCNSAIGFLRESPLLARAAATYLEQQLTKEFTGE
jgi:hypothetical protein